jgi:Domain of Unknown Function (DUF928)
MNLRLPMLLLAAFSCGDLAAQSQPPAADSEIEYRPPMRGAPARRVGGASRGGDALPAVSVLAPDHVGLTTSEQPTLYWFISKATPVRVELTLIDAQGTAPLIELSVDGKSAGLQRLDLAAHNVRLKPDVEYQWSVSLVPNAQERSNDTMSSGVVKRVALDRDTAARVAAARTEQRATVLAASGIWYDALAALSDEIAARPDDRALRERRARILEQAGLKDAAAYERALGER